VRYLWSSLSQTWVRALPPRVPGRVAIISDCQEPLLHPVTGEILDSKSQFRARTRAAGCLELGNDAPAGNFRPQGSKKELRRDISEAISMVEQGYQHPMLGPLTGSTRRYG
jgi:hypothetical protein